MSDFTLSFYQVDAFTDRPLDGNPAAVIPLESWMDVSLMQQIAAENNLSETAFLVPHLDGYQIRWFTPNKEAALCGHATLASAFVVFNHLNPDLEEINFYTRYHGQLIVQRKADFLRMNFPLLEVQQLRRPPAELDQIPHKRAYEADKLILELDSEASVKNFQPNLSLIGRLHHKGVAITALSDRPGVDFVSRYFAPNYGINEDPVTGSLHCALADLWYKRLGKTTFKAEQVGARLGKIGVRLENSRVYLEGKACLVIEGKIHLKQVPQQAQAV